MDLEGNVLELANSILMDFSIRERKVYKNWINMMTLGHHFSSLEDNKAKNIMQHILHISYYSISS